MWWGSTDQIAPLGEGGASFLSWDNEESLPKRVLMPWHMHLRAVQIWPALCFPHMTVGHGLDFKKQWKQHKGRIKLSDASWTQMTSFYEHCSWILGAVHKHSYLKVRFRKSYQRLLTSQKLLIESIYRYCSLNNKIILIFKHGLFAFSLPSSYWNLHKLLWETWIFFSLSSQVNYNKCYHLGGNLLFWSHV